MYSFQRSLVFSALAFAGFAVASSAFAAPPAGYQLVFKDDFTGSVLDTSQWAYRQNSYDVSSNVTVSGGALHLNMTRVSTATDKSGYRGGGIVSKKAFGYGYYETSAKLINDNGGWHPSFWTQIWDGQFAKPAYNANFTEVDLFEGYSGTSSNGGYLTWVSSTGSDSQLYSSSRASFSGDQYSAYHTYGVDYEATGMSFYFDGTLVKTLTYSSGSSTPYNSPMSMWLSVIPYNTSLLDSTQPVGHSYGTIDFDYVAYYTPTGTTPTTTPATRAASVTTYTNTFESGTAANWTTNGVGSWSVVSDGDYVYKNSSTSGDAISWYSDSTTSSSTWANSSIEAGIKFYNSLLSSCGIVGRYADANNYYYLKLDASLQQVLIQKKVAGTVTTIASAPLTIALATTYNLKLAMKDEQLTGYVNGSAVVSATDPSLIVGNVGVKSYNQSFSANHVYVNPL